MASLLSPGIFSVLFPARRTSAQPRVRRQRLLSPHSRRYLGVDSAMLRYQAKVRRITYQPVTDFPRRLSSTFPLAVAPRTAGAAAEDQIRYYQRQRRQQQLFNLKQLNLQQRPRRGRVGGGWRSALRG